VHSIDELKQSLLHVWHGIDQTIIDNTIDEWRGRLAGKKLTVQATVTIFSHMTRNVLVFVKILDTIFRLFFL